MLSAGWRPDGRRSPHAGSQLSAWQTEMLQQQLKLRQRSQRRFPDPNQWLWTDRSLAQASDWWSAKYKATLFPSECSIIDACCGAGVDLVALAARCRRVAGVDCDPAMVAIAKCNLAAHGFDVPVRLGRVPADIADESCWIHLDPDRRQGSQRTLRAEDFSPSLSELLPLAERMQGAVIKVAPATLIPPALVHEMNTNFHRRWIGNSGECRQQLWLSGRACHTGVSDECATTIGQRSAVLCEPNAPALCYPTNRHDIFSQETDALYATMPEIASTSETISSTPSTFVYELHSVLHAAELQTAWASEHGLTVLESEQGYFTSSSPVSSPWIQRFETLAVLPWDDRRLRRWLRERRIGTVEVKKRLIQLNANEAQQRYTSDGNESITLLVTRLAGRVRAIAARRCPTTFQPRRE